MAERRVRVSARTPYGRPQPLRRPRQKAWRPPSIGPRQMRLVVLLVVIAICLWLIGKAFATTQVVVQLDDSDKRIQNQTLELIKGDRWDGNLITVNTTALAAKLQQADPLLKNVTVKRQFPHTVVVSAKFKQPSLGWSSGNQAYLLDRDGTAIGPFPAGSKLPVVYDGSNLPVKAGARVVSAQFVSFAAALVPALAAQGITATHLDVADTTQDLTVATNKGYRLVFDTGRSVAEEITDLKSVQATLAAQKKAPAEYIDLRIAGKAYYK